MLKHLSHCVLRLNIVLAMEVIQQSTKKILERLQKLEKVQTMKGDKIRKHDVIFKSTQIVGINYVSRFSVVLEQVFACCRCPVVDRLRKIVFIVGFADARCMWANRAGRALTLLGPGGLTYRAKGDIARHF